MPKPHRMVAQCPGQNENFANTSKKPPQNRNQTPTAVRQATRRLEPALDITEMIAPPPPPKSHPQPPEIHFSTCSKILLHSGWLNSLFGDMITVDSKVRRLIGNIVAGLFVSLRISTIRSLEFTINSISVTKVLIDSLFKDKLYVRRSPSNMFVAVRTWRSQIPPICAAASALWDQSIQAARVSCKNFLILSWLISLNLCCNLFLALTKFVPLFY